MPAPGHDFVDRLRVALSAAGGGALLALAALAVESLLGLWGAWRLEAAAVYAAVGGLALSVWSWPWRSHHRARRPALGAGLLVVPTVWFVTNTELLAGDPWNSPRSLSVSLLTTATVVGFALAAEGWLAGRARPRAVALAVTWLGAVVWLAALIVVARVQWPPRHPARGANLPDIVLIVADSVRRDRLGLHGYPGVAGATSPRLDALAPSARVFDRAFAGSSWTAPSVRALLSPDWSPRSVPAELGSAGYATAALTENPNLTPRSGLVQDFQTVQQAAPPWRFALGITLAGRVLDRVWPRDDAALVSRAARWWQATPPPRFLYVHLMDAHVPFTRPPLDGRATDLLLQPVTGMRLTEAQRADARARYEAAVHSTLASAADLVEALAADEPLVIITADHGESLGEDGRWVHGQTLAPELLAVPLLLRGPGVRPGRVTEVAGADDVASTLLKAALGSCDPCPGVDLRHEAPRGVAEGGLPPHLLFRIRDGHRVVLDRRTGRLQLFDLREPEADIAALRPDLARALAAGLERRFDVPAPPAEARERLRALGYVD